MKKKVILSVFFVMALAFLGSLVSAEPIYFEGEGYFEPTPTSQEPLKIDMLKKALSAGDNVNVSVLPDNFPKIVLYVTVQDASGNYIGGLTKGDFTVQEDGTTETITSFSASQGGGSGINVTLVFDVSGSMSGSRLADAKDAAKAFVNSCNPQKDRIGLVSFASYNQIVVEMPSSYIYTDNNSNGIYDIIDKIDNLDTKGATAMFDGTMAGLQEMISEPSPKAVVVFTDGSTNNDLSYTINDVITTSNNNSIPLYTCSFQAPSSAKQNLIDMAAHTGGKYRDAPTGQDMQDFYLEIGGQLAYNYNLTYTTSNPSYDGSMRTVTVSHDGITTGTGTYLVNYKPRIDIDAATRNLNSISQQPNTDLNIRGTVIDLNAEAEGQNMTATLYYRHVNSSGYTSQGISLTNEGGGTYSFSETIPGSVVQEPGIQYYLYVSDGVQETHAPYGHTNTPFSIAVQPNHAPSITHTALSTASCGQSVTINAVAVDTDDNDSISRVALYYRTHDVNQITPYHTLEMTNTGGNNYTAEISASFASDPGIDYFIAAWDSFIVRADHGDSANPHFIQISCGGSSGCTIQMDSGWNMIGYCADSEQTVGTALASIDGLYDAVWYYENGYWKVYDAQFPAFSDLNVLRPCHGYWILMNSSGTLTFP